MTRSLATPGRSDQTVRAGAGPGRPSSGPVPAGRGYCTQRGLALSIAVGADDLAPAAGGQRPPGHRTGRILGEGDVAVAVQRVDAAGVGAARRLPRGVVRDERAQAVVLPGVGRQVVVVEGAAIVAVPPAV